jgi:hypothetical protein
MFAYLGLSCEPAQVESVTADHVTLKSDRFYVRGLSMLVELVNARRNFKCALILRVEDVQPTPDCCYILEAAFSCPLTDDQLRHLV